MASLDDIRDFADGIELSDEMLEGVSGGELNEFAQMFFEARINTFKNQGKSREDLIAWVQKLGEGSYTVEKNGLWVYDPGLSQEHIDDIIEYVNQHW